MFCKFDKSNAKMTALDVLKFALPSLVLLGFCVGHSFSQEPEGIEEYPTQQRLVCSPENEEYLRKQINVSNLLYLTYHNDYIYFYFKEILVKQAAPQLWQMTDDADELQHAYLLSLRPPEVALYRGSGPEKAVIRLD